MHIFFSFREGSGSGLWLTCLLPLSVAFGAWRYSASFIYSTTGVVAAGLLGTTVLYLVWSPSRVSSPVSKLLFVVPPIGTLLGLLYIHNGKLLFSYLIVVSDLNLDMLT